MPVINPSIVASKITIPITSTTDMEKWETGYNIKKMYL